jgi:hypothetical protein
MKPRRSAVAVWLLFAILVVTVFAAFSRSQVMEASTPLEDFLMVAIPLAFGFVSALIISRRPANVIGWLLMSPAFMAPFDILARATAASFPTAPSSPSLLLMVALWFQMTGWVSLIFPLFLILQLFPTGRPISSRWRWVSVVTVLMALAFLVVASTLEFFPNSVEEELLTWTVPNPIGLLAEPVANQFFTFWAIGLPLVALASGAALIVRFRRANTAERQQIKWLLFTCTIFVVTYIPQGGGRSGLIFDIITAIWALSLLAIPAAIAVAILRHQLFDIDFIIRRTLLYGLLTAFLALVYFGGVTLLQNLFESATGQSSPISIVLSTLVIAALFAPLRRRLQDLIDRRFYRSKYNAVQALDQFAATARDEVELEALSRELLRVVEHTVQPSHAGLWLMPARPDGSSDG